MSECSDFRYVPLPHIHINYETKKKKDEEERQNYGYCNKRHRDRVPSLSREGGADASSNSSPTSVTDSISSVSFDNVCALECRSVDRGR